MNKANMFANEQGYKEADHLNKEGHPSFSRSLKEQFVQCLLTNTVENTFYASQRDLVKEAVAIHTAMLKEDPEFYAKAVIYARNEGYMRLQPNIALVTLSTHEDKKLFRAAFSKVIRTPKDLATFVEFSKEAGIRVGLGRAVKEAINGYLNGLSEYHVIKYGSDSGQYSMRNILRLTKPVPASPTQSQLFGYLTGGEWEGKHLQQVQRFEALKVATDVKKQIELIEKGRLPHEVVTGSTKMTTEIWEYTMKQMPYFALLRNLNTLERHDVFKKDENVDYVVKQLTNEEAIAKSMILPFRFFSAYQMFDGPQDIRDALVDAMELSFVNMPELKGHVVIANDISGSMSCSISDRGNTRYCDIAGIFGAAMFKKAVDKVTLLPFHGHVVPVTLSRRDSIMTIAEKLSQCTNGTDIGAPVKYMNEHKIEADVFIGITDNIEWMTTSGGWYSNSRGFKPEWDEYVARNPKCKAFLITISPYRDAVADEKTKNVHFIYGWNDSVPNYIASVVEGLDTQISHIEKVKLDPSGDKDDGPEPL